MATIDDKTIIAFLEKVNKISHYAEVIESIPVADGIVDYMRGLARLIGMECDYIDANFGAEFRLNKSASIIVKD